VRARCIVRRNHRFRRQSSTVITHHYHLAVLTRRGLASRFGRRPRRGGAAPPLGPLPNYLVIGAAKAGTTSLANYLAAHPEAFMTPEKELNFFDLNYGAGLDWYRRRFAGATTERAVGEASVSYLFHPEAPPRMAEHVPAARLVALLRHPVDRAYSHYWFRRGWGVEHQTFEEAVEIDDDPDTGRAYVARGRYLPQLLRVCEHFPREQLLVLLLEDLKGDPDGTFSTVCRHLGIDDTVVPRAVGEVFNAVPEFRSERFQRALIGVHERRPLPLKVRRGLMRLNTRSKTYPRLDPAVRRRLAERFRDDNAALGEWLGRDLSHWND
jgi:hypothetical protein